MVKKICIILTIPEPLNSELNDEIKELHKKYSSFCKSSHPNNGTYFDIPHITLFSMGYCYENKGSIEAKLRELVRKHKPITIKSKELTLFEFGDQCHLVVKIEKNKELQDLHNKIITELTHLAKKKEKFILDLYNPHSSKILYLPKEIGEKVKKDAKIKEFKFTANEIGIKVRQENHYCIIEKRIKLA
jgi:2'-5' RNA ligase